MTTAIKVNLSWNSTEYMAASGKHISPLQEEKNMKYIYSTLNELRMMVSPRHKELARLLDNTIEHSAGLVASAQDYVDQNR